MSFLFDDGYYKVGKNGVSPFQNMHFHLCPIETRVGERRYVLCRCAYLGGSAIQTVGDNPVTAYRQLVQQYARPPRPSVTNPLSRLEVIMQTNSLKGNSISTVAALKELSTDMAKFGLAGIFRGQGIGIAKAIVSLTLFHEGRIFITNQFKQHNLKKLEP